MTDIRITTDDEIDTTNGSASLIRDEDALVQRLKIRTRSWQGDWFLSLGSFVPYHGRVFVRGANEADLLAIFNDVWETCPGVVSVSKLELDVGDSDDRTMRLDGTVFGEVGEAVEVSTTLPEI